MVEKVRLTGNTKEIQRMRIPQTPKMTSKAGGTIIKGKLKAAVLPGVLVFLIHVFVTPVNRGIAILACIPLCILCAWVLYRMGQIRVVHLPQGGDR